MEGICINCELEKVIHSRGLCRNCYQKLMKTKDFNLLYPSKRKSRLKKCKVDGCERNSRANGYCQRHYSQLRNNGKLLDINPNRSFNDKNEIRINKELNCGELIVYDNKNYQKAITLIDLEDIEKIKDIKWCQTNEYISSQYGFLHRFLMNCNNKNLVVDHINHNKLDNRKENLRVCTQKENCRNLSLSSKNTSGVIGVNLDKTNKWKAIIMVDNKNIVLGYYDNKDDAIKERLKAEVYYFKDFAPQKHLFKDYSIDINEHYIVKEYNPRKQGNKLGIKGIFKGSGIYKDKWKVEFTLNKKKVYLGYYNTLEEAIKVKEDYILNNKLK